MEKLNQRGNALPSVLAVVLAVNLGMVVGKIVQKSQDDVETKVQDAQMYNADVRRQLAGSYERIEDLFVDPESNNFNFNTVGDSGHAEVCEGKFKVSEDTARVTGKIACTFNSSLNR